METKPSVSTYFNKSDDTYYQRVTCGSDGMYLIYDSVGTMIGIADEYIPEIGTHLLGIYSLSITRVDFDVLRSVGKSKNRLQAQSH